MSFPDVSEAFSDWTSNITLEVVMKRVEDFEVAEENLNKLFIDGVLEPMPKRELLIKPEGQRQWGWWTFWTLQYLDLDTILKDNEGKTYRVMSSQDWANSGHYVYDLAQGVPL